MSNWIATTRSGKPEKVKAFDDDFDAIAAWLGTHPTSPPKGNIAPDLLKGNAAFEKHCNRCHTFDGKGGRTEASLGPDFTGYGNAAWIRLMIMSPDHPSRFGRDNRNVMTVFRDLHGPEGEMAKLDEKRIQEMLLKKLENADKEDPLVAVERDKIVKSTTVSHLSNLDRELIIRFLVGDDRPAFFGPAAIMPGTGAKTK